MTKEHDPTDSRQTRTTDSTRSNPERTVLGAVAGAAIGAGLWGMFVSEDPGWPGITLRSGIILAAIWLALPSLRRLRSGTWMALAAPVLVLLVRPRLIVWGLGAGVVIWIANRRLGRPVRRASAREAPRRTSGRGDRMGSRSTRPEEGP